MDIIESSQSRGRRNKKGISKKRQVFNLLSVAQSTNLGGLLEASADDAAEHVNADALALDLAADLVLLVRGHLDHGVGAGLVDHPAADLGDELLEGLTVGKVQPLLQNVGVDLTEGLSDLDGDTDAHKLLETGNVGNQIGVQVIRVQGGPELSVLGGFK